LDNFITTTTLTTTLKLEQVSLFTRLKTPGQGKHLGHPILQNVSFTAAGGDRLAIVGNSGAGKTSLLRLINRLTEVSSGKIYLDSREYTQIPLIQLRQQITLVQPETKLLGMTVEETLAYPLVLRGLSQQIIQQRVNHYREQLQIPHQWLNKTEVELALGQRQLVAIARALAIQPKILLLDEPTSALDRTTAGHVMEILTQISQTQSTIVLMVNRQIDLAQEFCTRLLHIQQGQLLVNQLSSNVSWENLKANLSEQATQTAEEWGV
jgi:D-methionine transport system ATP-binding protein